MALYRTLAALPLLTAAALAADADGNRLKNPGFESVGKDGVASWSVPSYWSGTLASKQTAPHAGTRCATLTTGESRGRIWGRILHNGTFPVELARRMRFSVWARGNGELLMGIIRYSKRVGNEPNYHYLWQDPAIQLTPEWREIAFEFTITDPRFLRIACCIELRGKDSVADLDDVSLVPVAAQGIEAAVQPTHPMLPPGGTADVHVQLTSTNGKPTPSGAVTLLAIPPEGDTRSSTFTLDKQGRATCTFAPADGPVGIWKLVLAHPDSGWARSIDADVLPKQQYALFEKAAAALPDLPHPPHYLFLGDSLTDMFRGQNYVDKIEFWLQKRYGDSASVRNAGVGGDFITRVWDRLTGEPKAYRLNMYDDLYTPKPDRIFIFLGHNDSKATSSSGYTKHCVDPDTFATLYAKTLEKLKADTDAPVTVLTSTSSVYEITAENARKRTEAGKAHNLFGKPEHLELFNSIAARVAKDAGCDLLDVYAPTRDAPDKKALFVADGVHVSNKGNRLLARLILDYLGSLPQRP